jgi:hypothetical protein
MSDMAILHQTRIAPATTAFSKTYPVLSWSGERANAFCLVLDRPGDPTTGKIEDSQGLVASHPPGIGL